MWGTTCSDDRTSGRDCFSSSGLRRTSWNLIPNSNHHVLAWDMSPLWWLWWRKIFTLSFLALTDLAVSVKWYPENRTFTRNKKEFRWLDETTQSYGLENWKVLVFRCTVIYGVYWLEKIKVKTYWRINKNVSNCHSEVEQQSEQSCRCFAKILTNAFKQYFQVTSNNEWNLCCRGGNHNSQAVEMDLNNALLRGITMGKISSVRGERSNCVVTAVWRVRTPAMICSNAQPKSNFVSDREKGEKDFWSCQLCSFGKDWQLDFRFTWRSQSHKHPANPKRRNPHVVLLRHGENLRAKLLQAKKD